MNKTHGFTLIELMTVVVIVAILAALALPQYTRSVRRSEMVEGLTNGKILYESAVRYRQTNGEPASDFNQLDASLGEGSTIEDGNFNYILQGDRLIAESTKGDYAIHFMIPIRNNSGFYAPIACCPGTSWICQNAAVESNTTGMPSGCREIK